MLVLVYSKALMLLARSPLLLVTLRRDLYMYHAPAAVML